jgi:hypothetical protein
MKQFLTYDKFLSRNFVLLHETPAHIDTTVVGNLIDVDVAY